MTKCEKYICEWAYDFVNENWDKINHKKCDLNGTTKEKFLKDVKTKPQDAMWFIVEVMDWGMDNNYYKDLYVYPKPNEITNEAFRVIKLGEKYIKWRFNEDFSYTMTFTEPKTKTVTIQYWE